MQCLTPPKKFKRVPSAWKMMASIIWDSQGIIMIDFLEQGRTINGTYYANELRHLRQKIARKRSGKLIAFCSCMTMRQLTNSKLGRLLQLTAAFIPHPPYSPTWFPLTSSCFQNWKPSIVVDVLEAMKVSWRRPMSSLRTEIDNSILKG
jgi:hypothetical protein